MNKRERLTRNKRKTKASIALPVRTAREYRARWPREPTARANHPRGPSAWTVHKDGARPSARTARTKPARTCGAGRTAGSIYEKRPRAAPARIASPRVRSARTVRAECLRRQSARTFAANRSCGLTARTASGLSNALAISTFGSIGTLSFLGFAFRAACTTCRWCASSAFSLAVYVPTSATVGAVPGRARRQVHFRVIWGGATRMGSCGARGSIIISYDRKDPRSGILARHKTQKTPCFLTFFISCEGRAFLIIN